MDNNEKKEIVTSKRKDLTLASSELAIRGLEIISELSPLRIHVPNDYPTIAEALEHAADGDTIELAEGIYHESLQITKPVTIIGAIHSRVILEPLNLTPIFTYNVSHGISKVKNIVFRKVSEQDFVLGIDANGEFFEFEDCQFKDFSCSDDYMSTCDEEFWYKFGTNTAVQIGNADSKVKFLHCIFDNFEIGIKVNERSSIELSNCSFISSSYGESPKSILTNKYCRLKSSSCFFSKVVIELSLHTYYESSYDTFLDVNGIIRSYDLCEATFSHATFVSDRLLTIALPEKFDVNVIDYYSFQNEPLIHFSNSIVFVKNGYEPEACFTKTGEKYIIYDFASITNLENHGILSFTSKNLLNIPPHLLSQDPLIIFENGTVRLSRNSPAIKSASDGTNLGAWQGD